MELTFHVEQNVDAALARVPALVNEGRTAVGRAIRNRVVEHLQGLPTNKAGFPSTGFYASAAESVTQPVIDGVGVYISITQLGMRQRYLGGDIVPPWKNGSPSKYLAIPAQGFGYGIRARSFTGLVFLWGRDKEGMVRPIALMASDDVRNPGSGKRTKSGAPKKLRVDEGSIIYWLVKSVHQEPDPAVLPTQQELNDAATEGLLDFLFAAQAEGAL
jgi:hypothetical protein